MEAIVRKDETERSPVCIVFLLNCYLCCCWFPFFPSSSLFCFITAAAGAVPHAAVSLFLMACVRGDMARFHTAEIKTILPHPIPPSLFHSITSYAPPFAFKFSKPLVTLADTITSPSFTPASSSAFSMVYPKQAYRPSSKFFPAGVKSLSKSNQKTYTERRGGSKEMDKEVRRHIARQHRYTQRNPLTLNPNPKPTPPYLAGRRIRHVLLPGHAHSPIRLERQAGGRIASPIIFSRHTVHGRIILRDENLQRDVADFRRARRFVPMDLALGFRVPVLHHKAVRPRDGPVIVKAFLDQVDKVASRHGRVVPVNHHLHLNIYKGRERYVSEHT